MAYTTEQQAVLSIIAKEIERTVTAMETAPPVLGMFILPDFAVNAIGVACFAAGAEYALAQATKQL